MKKILCPTDFSDTAKNAVIYANEVARKCNGELIFIHTYYFPPIASDVQPYIDPELNRYTDTESRNMLETLCGEMRKDTRNANISYGYIVKNGFIIDELKRVVEENKIDMVIMGTKGASGMDEIFFGSVSASVVEGIKCPVIVVPNAYQYQPISQIVYATDLKNEETELINYVVDFAKMFNSHVAFLNIQAKEPENAKDIISYALSHLINSTEYNELSFHVIEDKEVIKGINSFAQERKAELLVMGTYKRNMFQKIISGSLTKKMTNHSNIPVLALHKHKIEEEAQVK